MKNIFKKSRIALLSLVTLLGISGCGLASQVKITGTESGELAVGTSLVYDLDHKTQVHGQKVADALRVLPSEIIVKAATSDGKRTEEWTAELKYYTVSDKDVAGVEEVLSPDVFAVGGELETSPIVAKCGGDELEIGVASKCEKMGTSESTYGYTHFEISSEWIDAHFLDKLSVVWSKLNSISLKEFRYVRPAKVEESSTSVPPCGEECSVHLTSTSSSEDVVESTEESSQASSEETASSAE